MHFERAVRVTKSQIKIRGNSLAVLRVAVLKSQRVEQVGMLASICMWYAVKAKVKGTEATSGENRKLGDSHHHP